MMKDNSYKTAITRKGPSAPLKYLIKKGLIGKERLDLCLDYGSGKGADGRFLTKEGHFILDYDPHYHDNQLM